MKQGRPGVGAALFFIVPSASYACGSALMPVWRVRAHLQDNGLMEKFPKVTCFQKGGSPIA
ncbi:hypothetical protein [Komagataeibacter swingsii]|uniref:hypothetical protein n=1 Tax=Komagataeibacter swingsii TaxID=215220 RepID=UPI0011B4E3AA|nr:hypothetical protein [Komagataeibacter swingsii]